MAAMRSRCGHYIFALWFLLCSIFFPRLISAVACCGLSANLGCRSEMFCTRLAGNTARKNDAKKSPSTHHRTTLSSYIFATANKAYIDNRKNLLNSNISSTCPHNMVNFGPLVAEAEIDSVVWGTPANFNGFRVLASLLQRRRSPETNQTLGR